MAVAFVSDAGTTSSTGGSFTATAPAGTSAGNVVRATILVYDTITSTPTISGWTIYRTDSFQNGTAQGTVRYLYRVLDGVTDSYAVSVPSGDYTEVYIAAYSGADTTTPIVDTGNFSQGSAAGAITISGVTVSNSGSFLTCDIVYYNMGNTNGPTAPGTWNTRELNFDGGALSVYDSAFSGTGATGNITGASVSNLGGAIAWGAVVGVIAPAAGAATVEVPVPPGNTMFFGGSF